MQNKPKGRKEVGKSKETSIDLMIGSAVPAQRRRALRHKGIRGYLPPSAVNPLSALIDTYN